MKIAVIRKECSLLKGGAERYCANLCRALAERGHQVYVLAHKMDSDLHPDLQHIPIQVNSFSSSSKNLSFHRNCQNALKQLQVDRVYALSRSYPADAVRVSDPLHSAWMKLRYPSKWRLFVERLNPRHRAILRLENGMYQPDNVGVIITNSRLTKRQVNEIFGYPLERIYVVYNGVDLQKFSPAREYKPVLDKIRLLFVAMDFRRKGLHHLLKGLSLIKKSSCKYTLDVVGKGDAKVFGRIAEKLGLLEVVRFHGPSRKVEKFYRSADLLVFPTQYDPFANVCLEAMACGLPVVTTTINGASEILQEGKNGFVLNESNDLAGQIAAKINCFAAMSPENRVGMAKRARQTAETFTIARNVDETLEILRSSI